MNPNRSFMLHLTQKPMHTVWRFFWAALFSGMAIWLFNYSLLSGDDQFFAERWSKSVQPAVTFGTFFGVVVLFAAEIPERLRGFWPRWACFLLSFVVGLIMGTLWWGLFQFFVYFIGPRPGEPFYLKDQLHSFLGGLGIAVAFALRSTIRIPALVAVVWAAIAIYVPIHVTWFAFVETNAMASLIYVRPSDNIYQYALLFALCFALGVYAYGLFEEARSLFDRNRTAVTTE